MNAAHPLQVFRDGCAIGELRYQRCRSCGRVQTYPRATCERCRRTTLEWLTSQRSGTLATWTTVHRAANPRFQARAPYTLALVDMAEGFRLMMNVDADIPLTIGAAIAVDFVDDDGTMRVHGRVSR